MYYILWKWQQIKSVYALSPCIYAFLIRDVTNEYAKAIDLMLWDWYYLFPTLASSSHTAINVPNKLELQLNVRAEDLDSVLYQAQ